MTATAFMGPAGVGKTHNLMAALGAALVARPIADGERVLALTFMHGSRRRLDARLAEVAGLRNRYSCTTIDRFAWELCVRWQTLRRSLRFPDLRENEYDATCDAAGALLERADVGSWIARSYPFVVVDEAQDLRPERLRIVKALAARGALFCAADDFQCLDPGLRPNPGTAWIAGTCHTTLLTLPRRTNIPGLLAAAEAIRTGGGVRSVGQEFVVMPAPGRAPFALAATCVANAIAWSRGGGVAVITPSKAGGFAAAVLDRVRAGPVGTRQNGPYEIPWELSDAESMATLERGLVLPENGDGAELLAALDAATSDPVLRRCREWVSRQRRIGAISTFPPALVRQRLALCLTQHRRQSRAHGTRLRAMSVHQAKNREFDGVVVIWPYRFAGDAEQQRRLLYNAVTRARRWCTVIAQAETILGRPPFAAG